MSFSCLSLKKIYFTVSLSISLFLDIGFETILWIVLYNKQFCAGISVICWLGLLGKHLEVKSIKISPCPSSATEHLCSLPSTSSPACISYGSHRLSPTNIPLPTCCFTPAPNSTRHPLISHKPFLLGNQVFWLQIFTSSSVPLDPIFQSHPHFCNRTSAAISLLLVPTPCGFNRSFLPNFPFSTHWFIPAGTPFSNKYNVCQGTREPGSQGGCLQIFQL